MIAALPMYDRPETAAANDAAWAAIRARLGRGPMTLCRPSDPWPIWQSPDLLLAQTCGLPFRARLHPHVGLIGTPDYGLDGCPPGYYRSVFVARAGDPAGLDELANRRFAYNEPLSQSGWAAPAAHLAELGLGFGTLVQTGAHRASALAVAENRADFAALDAVTWQLIRTYDPFAAELRVVGKTRPTPGLPYITAQGNDPSVLFSAISAAIDDLPPSVRGVLHLKGLVAIPADEYLAQPLPPDPGAI